MSSAFDGGIERGTVLLEINRRAGRSVADYRRIARAARAGDILTLYVYAPDSISASCKPSSRQTVIARSADRMSPACPNPRILVIDDEAAIRDRCG